MDEFIKKVEDALETENIEEAKRLSDGFLWNSLHKSMNEQLVETYYFPSLNLEYLEEFNPDIPETNTEIDELKERAMKRINDDPALFITAQFDEQAIEDITSYNFITLFEIALLIGYRIEHDPKAILVDCPALFLDAIINRQIDPRDPATKIPASKLHKLPKVIGDKVFFTKNPPDLSWLLTLKEAAEFAILKGYPEHLFSDLINDNFITNTPPAEQPANTKTAEVRELIETERITMLKLIIGMAIDAYGYNPEASKNTATGGNKNSISVSLQRRGINVSDDTIRRILNKAKDIL